MKKKNYYLIGLISLMLLSCSSDDESKKSVSTINQEIKIMNFASVTSMENKIDEIITIKTEKERITLANFASINKSSNFKKNIVKDENERIFNALKQYHTNVLNDIYELRKQINFVSIKSMAEEINSLKLINPTKATELRAKYGNFLKEYQNSTHTIFDERISNVINLEGDVFLKGDKIIFNTKSNNIAEKYIEDQFVNSGIAASSGNLVVYYSAGRELHKNDLGIDFYRYYTQLSAMTKVYIGLFPTFIPVPMTYTVNNGSIAGFVQTGSAPFADYSFTYNYISGYGPVVRNTGEKMNTPFKPAGGKLSATFSTTLGGVQKIMTCDFKYTEK